jgi:hypothetical protein
MTNRTEHNRAQYLKNREARLQTQKEYYSANRDARLEYNKKYAEQNADRIREQRRQYRLRSSELRKQAMRDWYSKNAETAKLAAKAYREANREKLAARAREYRKQRRISDPIYDLTIRIRCLINVKLWVKGFTKKSKTYEILGCSYDEFAWHLESQFCEGMSWSNRSDWHIDHIVPIASALTEDDVVRLNHYTNLRPMWASDNLKKGSRHEPT